MRDWLTMLAAVADMQSGDIDKMAPEEARVVRELADAIARGDTLCLTSEDQALINKGLDRLGLPKPH
jgi:hypothetical protein